jgi:hypothetical protein
MGLTLLDDFMDFSISAQKSLVNARFPEKGMYPHPSAAKNRPAANAAGLLFSLR